MFWEFMIVLFLLLVIGIVGGWCCTTPTTPFLRYHRLLYYTDSHAKPTELQVPIFYINLDRDIDQNQVMQHHLKRFSSDIHRISGVDASAIHNLTADTIGAIEFVNGYDQLSKADLARTLSHICAIYQAYQSGAGMALILEDDARLDLLHVGHVDLVDISQRAPDDWSLIQLFYAFEDELERLKRFGPADPDAFGFYQYNGKKARPYATTAYLIRRRGMRRILQSCHIDPTVPLGKQTIVVAPRHGSPTTGSSDCFLNELVSTYILYPSIIFPNNLDESDHSTRSLHLVEEYLSKPPPS